MILLKHFDLIFNPNSSANTHASAGECASSLMGLARLTVVANAVLKLVLARIEIRVLTLLVFLELLKDLLLLFVRQLLAINALVFLLDLSHFLVILLLLFCPDNS